MNIPQPDNVSNVLVDGVLWHTEPRNGVPGWASPGGRWLDVPAFSAYLDSAAAAAFYSPTGRVIDPE